jgi:hypothetical protein
MTWTLAPACGGTMMTVTVEDVPSGIRTEHHEVGMALLLTNLAAMAERSRLSA